MQKIEKNAACGNMTGNKKIFIAPTDEIESIELIDIRTRKVVMKRDGQFGGIEANNIQFNSAGEAGHYIHEVSCTLTSTKGKYDTFFERMKNKRWVVKIEDNNSIVWLAGSLSEPFRFKWEHIGESKACGQHGYRLTFFRNSTEPLYTTML